MNKFLINSSNLVVIILNLILIGSSVLIRNDFLIFHSYILYGIQAAIVIPSILKQTTYIKNLFLPSFFTLVYYLVNLSIGGYLTPRGFGYYKAYAPHLLSIDNYNTIVPFYLFCNLILFILSVQALKKLNSSYKQSYYNKVSITRLNKSNETLRTFFLFSLFILLSNININFLFPIQLATIIIILINIVNWQSIYRQFTSFFILFIMISSNHDNKREIAIVLFLIVFIEAFFSSWKLKFDFRNSLLYILVTAIFFSLIISASILRGYGGFGVTSVPDAILHIPKYIKSDVFVDGFTDNLELNFNYGAANVAIEKVIKGDINYQYGKTLLKIFFLPIPRELLPKKPESTMQIFTKSYRPDLWMKGGSLPVNFSGDMFINFHFGGLLVFFMIWSLINNLFINIHTSSTYIMLYSRIFLSITTLMIARGSGFELYILNYIFALSVFIIFFAINQLYKTYFRKHIE